ncbi:hypothetical protein FPV67DRAFT_1510566 [Lyophyllum atratum]|nr:hypothetical protein FPV67DRAFT_1510566 [Lyophyllum atratum]
MVKSVTPKIDAAPRAKGKGKQPKRFLDKNAALDLAAAIAEVQEGKSHSKVEKHQGQVGQPREDQKSKPSASKVKLRQTKARLAAQQTQVKKEKSKRRKQRSTDKPSDDAAASGTSPETSRSVVRKTVSFA